MQRPRAPIPLGPPGPNPREACCVASADTPIQQTTASRVNVPAREVSVLKIASAPEHQLDPNAAALNLAFTQIGKEDRLHGDRSVGRPSRGDRTAAHLAQPTSEWT